MCFPRLLRVFLRISLNENTGKTFIVRHVRFDENVFPLVAKPLRQVPKHDKSEVLWVVFNVPCVEIPSEQNSVRVDPPERDTVIYGQRNYRAGLETRA